MQDNLIILLVFSGSPSWQRDQWHPFTGEN